MDAGRRASSDFVLIDAESGPRVSNNSSVSDFVLVNSPRGQLVSNNQRCHDFVLPTWRSPTTERRSLRASRELDASDPWAQELVRRHSESEASRDAPPPLLKQVSWHAPFERGAAIHPVVTPNKQEEPATPTGVVDFYANVRINPPPIAT
jgi:hypothetical protein